MKNLINNFFSKFSEIKDFSLFEKIFLLAPILIWFSYVPNFNFGKSGGANLEFSLPLILCVILVSIAIVDFCKQWVDNFQKIKSNLSIKITFLFVIWNFATIFWSDNPLRTFLTSGVWLVLWIIFVGIVLSKNFRKIYLILEKELILSSLIVAIITIVQVAYGAFWDFGLCRGCVSAGFGFVRPSVFAIEPQFLGSLLLAPILILWWKFLVEKLTKSDFAALVLSLIAMYLTLSRGAIFALIIAMLLAVFIVSKSRFSLFRRFVIFCGIIMLTFSSGMFWHALFAEINPRISETFYGSVSKSISQLTLGKINFPVKPVEKPVEKAQDITPKNQTIEVRKPSFDGYVEKSTDERTKMSDLAIQTWLRDPRTIILGVGSGASGKAILDTTHKIANSSEIVQNEFLSILLELGIGGVIIWATILILFMMKTRKNKAAWVVLVAFLLQWNFFSGLPNALHIYLILAVIFGKMETAYEKKSAIN